jgi:hypothetical protein
MFGKWVELAYNYLIQEASTKTEGRTIVVLIILTGPGAQKITQTR